MNSERDSVDDLVVLARRGALPTSEQSRLREALLASAETRVLHDAGLEFDAEAPVLAGDEELIERMARRVQRGTRRLKISPRVRQAAQSMALGMLIAGLAIAAIEIARWHPRAKPGAASPVTSVHAPSAPASNLAHDQRLVPVTPEPALSEAPQNNPAPANGRRIIGAPMTANAPQTGNPGAPTGDQANSPTPADSAPASARFADAQNASPASKFKSASELFADANQARVKGDLPGAVAISQQLEATFPNSNEGITTHLSLGVLYMQQGNPTLALQEFKIYRHIGSSAVMAEALWGEEQALQQLGRPSEERAVLEELLQNYPRSAYAAAAEKRLAALNN
jgi:TolA-binding protein